MLVGPEDTYADTVVPRLMAAGADLSRVLFVNAKVGEWEDTMTLPDDIQGLRDAIIECDAKLVTIDPAIAFLGDKVDGTPTIRYVVRWDHCTCSHSAWESQCLASRIHHALVVTATRLTSPVAV